MELQTMQALLPKKEDFQQTIQEKSVELHYLSNDNIAVAITNYGARIVSILVKDRKGDWVDVIVGFDSLNDYLNTDEIYHGAIIGRYANRIAKGSFLLNGKVYTLAANNGLNHLHGGPVGFHDVVWNIESVTTESIVLRYIAADGEEGYPGELNVKVIYTLEHDSLRIDFKAISTADTILNLTNHAYFNLNGQGTGSVEKHLLQINAAHITAIDENLIPTGELMPVPNTPFDFTSIKEIGKEINDNHPQLLHGLGYDHNFVIDKPLNEWSLIAKAIGDQTRIALDVCTTEPGVQLYTGNFMKGINRIKQGRRDEHRSAFCLETQHFPDSPNHEHFPTTVLKGGEVFKSSTSFKFSVALP
jgi:aldose 1-epimerase